MSRIERRVRLPYWWVLTPGLRIHAVDILDWFRTLAEGVPGGAHERGSRIRDVND